MGRRLDHAAAGYQIIHNPIWYNRVMKTFIATIPGRAYDLAREGSLEKPAQRAIDNAHLVKRGRGRQAILSMSAVEANSLADYFWSVAGVVGDMSSGERDGGTEHEAAQQAVLRIEAAIRSS